MKTATFGPLRGHVVEPRTSGPELTVVLLHGFGAPGRDLVGLEQSLDVPGARFVYLEAPLVLEPGLPEAASGRAWWPLDMLELQRIRLSGDFAQLSSRKPAGIDAARDQLGAALDVLGSELGLAPERLVLGGFSQGAMLATDYALREQRPLAGLVVLSGSLLAEDEWLAALPGRRGLPVFQSHSPDDVVLPFALARRLGEEFSRAGLEASFVEFRGGHGIGPGVLVELSRFLRALSA